MARNVFRSNEFGDRGYWLPRQAGLEVEAEAPQSSRGVCRVSFRPSATALSGVTCMLAEFFASQVSPGAAASLSHVVRDLVRDWVRPGLDQSARVRTALWKPQLRCELDVQVSFSAPADETERVLSLVAELGRASGQFSYRLLPRAVGDADAMGVRAEGSIGTDVVPVTANESLVTSTLRAVLRGTAPG